MVQELWYNGGMKISMEKRKRLLRLFEYGVGLLVASGVFWLFYLFVKSEYWLPVSALATLLLAIAAFLTIRRSDEYREQDRKERLLNEIIEWAVDVAKIGIEPDTPELSDDRDAAKSWPFLDSQFKKLETLQLLRVRSVSAESIAQVIHKDLHEPVKDSIDNLRMQLRSLYDYKTFMDQHKSKGSDEKINFLTSTAKQVDKNNKLLYNSAVKVIEEASKIKTRDIGKKEENMSKEGEATGSNEPTLKDIEEHLKRQDRQMARTQWQCPFTLGLTAMIVGMTWVVARTQFVPDLSTGLFMTILGLLIVLLSLFNRYRKKA